MTALDFHDSDILCNYSDGSTATQISDVAQLIHYGNWVGCSLFRMNGEGGI